jgi:hypothetical protein
MMNRNDEIKNIMRKLRESKNESVKSTASKRIFNEATDTENDASESDLILARLEDILARFEKVISAADGESEKEPADDKEQSEEPAEDEEPVEDEEPAEDAEPAEDEEPAKESYNHSLESRLTALERRFTESRRRSLCKRFTR